MDKKQQINIPKYIWVIAGVLVICIIFLIVVQVPFSQKLGKYNSDHQSATAEISMYNDYLARAKEVSNSIVSMKAEYEKESDKLFVNGTKTADDIRDMLINLNYDPTSLNVQKGVVDDQGRASSAGDPLYKTIATFTFVSTEEEIVKTLKYFESESKGSYYISDISLIPAEESREEVVAEEPSEEGSGDGTSKAQSSVVSKQASVEDVEGKYQTTLTINLYYFNPEANEGNQEEAAADESSEE